MKKMIVLIVLFCLPLSVQAQKDKKKLDDLYLKGINISQENPKKAIEIFKNILKTDSSYYFALNALAGAKARTGDVNGAIADYTKAYSLSRRLVDSTMFLWNRASCKHNMQDYAGSVIDYRLMNQINPTYVSGYTQLARELIYAKKFAEALEVVQTVTSMPNADKDNIHAAKLIEAYTYMFLGDTEKAIEIHRVYKDYQFSALKWKEYVLEDFTTFKKAGLQSISMEKIETVLK